MRIHWEHWYGVEIWSYVHLAAKAAMPNPNHSTIFVTPIQTQVATNPFPSIHESNHQISVKTKAKFWIFWNTNSCCHVLRLSLAVDHDCYPPGSIFWHTAAIVSQSIPCCQYNLCHCNQTLPQLTTDFNGIKGYTVQS